MFEFSLLTSASWPRQPMYSQTAQTQLASRNLTGTFLHKPVLQLWLLWRLLCVIFYLCCNVLVTFERILLLVLSPQCSDWVSWCEDGRKRTGDRPRGRNSLGRQIHSSSSSSSRCSFDSFPHSPPLLHIDISKLNGSVGWWAPPVKVLGPYSLS